ncbi:hypothetical protein [Nocardia brevicatena]|nr:hypothetical protein [Nocardia brevicatena]
MGKHRKSTGRHRKKNAPANRAAVVAGIALVTGATFELVRWLRVK